jgi:purine-nucleoside/S-methyl-5'-thioadenosine phosphorylase / adenosine deaminase
MLAAQQARYRPFSWARHAQQRFAQKDGLDRCRSALRARRLFWPLRSRRRTNIQTMTAPAATTYEFRPRGGLETLAWPAFDGFGVDVAVTTRHGGVSSGPYATLNLALHVGDDPASVLENRCRAAKVMGADPGDFVFCNQTHGREARIVTAADRGRGAWSLDDAIGDADALVTTDPGTVLVVMVADCVPIVLYDPAAHVLACVHAGWRGTVAHVVDAALEAMATLGTRPENVIAGLGPAISPDGYQVGDEVAGAARKSFGAHADSVIRPDGTGKWLFDLWAANLLILGLAGVAREHSHVAAIPTSAEPGHFFSDRAVRPCGRFAAIAKLQPRGD